MASRDDELDNTAQQNNHDEYLQDPHPHQKSVEIFFNPIEAKWDFIRDVLLWKKPVYSLVIFIVVNGIFSYFASGNFRLFLIVNTLLGLGLCYEDIRIKASSILERAGITPEERESYEASLIFQRFCYKIALIWGFSELQLSNLKELRKSSKQKFYAVMVVVLVVASFAYQYLPWLKIFYGILLFLYLWPPAKYHGTHRVVIGMIEPFFRPFVVHWKNSRTKRQRNQILKIKKGKDYVEDSEEEFTKEFNPEPCKESFRKHSSSVGENIGGVGISSVKEKKEDLSQQSCDTEDKEPSLPQDPIDSFPNEKSEDNFLLPAPESLHMEIPESEEEFAEGLETPGGSTVSFNGSTSLLPDSQEFPSLSTNTDTWDFDDDDLALGLEFPDIDGNDYYSSTESLIAHPETTNKISQNKVSRVSTQQRGSASHQVKKRPKKQTSLITSQQPNVTAEGCDFEMLDRSEIEDINESMDNEGRASAGTGSSLGTFVGKMFGL